MGVSQDTQVGLSSRQLVRITGELQDHDVGFAKEVVRTGYVTLNCSLNHLSGIKELEALKKEGGKFRRVIAALSPAFPQQRKSWVPPTPFTSSQGSSLCREVRGHDESPAAFPQHHRYSAL